MTDDGTDKQQTTNTNGGSSPDQPTEQSIGRESEGRGSERQGSERRGSEGRGSEGQGSEPTSAQPITQSAAAQTTSSDTTSNPSADALPASPELRTLWHDALGNLSERQLLRALAATQVSGTLWLERPHHCSLLLLASGRTLVSFELDNTSESYRRVRLFAHPSDETTLLPRATSRYPKSHLPLLQALPDLPPEQHLSTASCDLSSLVQEQTEGLLVIETVPPDNTQLDDTQQSQHQLQRVKHQRGYALFIAGELRDVSLEHWSEGGSEGGSEGARGDTNSEVLEGTEALTALFEIDEHVAVSQWALAPFVSAGLLALRGERRDDSPPFLRLYPSTEHTSTEHTSTEDVLAEAPTDEMFDADAVILAQEDVADTDAVTNKVTNEVLEPNANALDLADVENTANENTANENTEDTEEIAPEDDTNAVVFEASEAIDPSEMPSVLEVSDAGYTFYDGGHACLHIPSTPVLAGGWYQTRGADSIALPDATSHIVKKYYRLTLRGRDALSPMMEIYTSVQKEFGNKGKDVLQALQKPRSSHALLEVEPDPDLLEDLLRRLARASLIFELDPNSPDIDLSDVP